MQIPGEIAGPSRGFNFVRDLSIGGYPFPAIPFRRLVARASSSFELEQQFLRQMNRRKLGSTSITVAFRKVIRGSQIRGLISGI